MNNIHLECLSRRRTGHTPFPPIAAWHLYAYAKLERKTRVWKWQLENVNMAVEVAVEVEVRVKLELEHLTKLIAAVSN